MIFTQFAFVGFFLVTALVHWALKRNQSRKIWLLCASYYFYGSWDYRFLVLIFGSTVLDYATAVGLGRAQTDRVRHWLITGSICANLGILGFFKYFNFFIDSAAALLTWFGFNPNVTTLNVVLPVGVSFFTFQSMSFTIDVYRRKLAPQHPFLDFALFVSFFPQLVAGPIARASHFLPQLETTRSFVDINVRRSLLLFTIGYFKKACIADNIAAAIDPLFNEPTLFEPASRVLGAALYSVQIYCDFSGYTDMATAVAAFFGYNLARNFDSPYLSGNIREFWQRWHISLSSWLRDYLYIPLGGNRGGEMKVARNLMLTMLLGGLWHGANWTFIIWGFLHGFGLVVHRTYTRLRPTDEAAGESTIGRIGSGALTFVWVALCFTIFRCEDITTAWQLFAGSTRRRAEELHVSWWGMLLVLGVAHYLIYRYRARLAEAAMKVPDAAFYPALGAACAVLLYLTALNLAPFIYFQF